MNLPPVFTKITNFNKFLALFVFLFLNTAGFLLGMQYQKAIKEFETDPRLRIFSTQEECESFVNRKCLPLLCEKDPNHISCMSNNQKGWFATRQSLDSVQEDSSNWEIYKNEYYGFTFKYPKGYVPQTLTTQIFSFSSPVLSGKNTNVNLTLNIYDEESVNNLAQLSSCSSILTTPQFEYPYIQNNSINIVTLYKDSACGVWGSSYIVFERDNDLYVLTITSSKGFDTIAEEVNQILSTFRFLDNDVIPTTSSTNKTTSCTNDSECWCIGFDGTKFTDEKVPNICNQQTKQCQICYYE